ncbi:MAG: hypothetical protein RSB14_00040 [Kiritimatiellia bacterium]
MKQFLAFLFFSCTMGLFAEFPPLVLDACFSTTVTDSASNRTWQIKPRTQWIANPIRISECEGTTTASQDGVAHPNGWATTAISIVTPPLTETDPCPIQRQSYTVRTMGVAPQTDITFTLINNKVLPPCTIKPWGDRLAIVSNANDWYLIAEASNARLTVSDSEPKHYTLTVPPITVKGHKDVTATLLTGEGPLPPVPPTRK